jgi:hypothetical protein
VQGKRSPPPAFEATAREEGDARERTRSHEVGAVLGCREGGYKAENAEVPPDASWEVGGDHGSEEGAESRTRRSDGSLLELRLSMGEGLRDCPWGSMHAIDKVRVLQRELYRAAKARPERTLGVLYEKVYSKKVLSYAWEQVRRNRGSAGIDNETIEDIEVHPQARWAAEAVRDPACSGSNRSSGGEGGDRAAV